MEGFAGSGPVFVSKRREEDTRGSLAEGRKVDSGLSLGARLEEFLARLTRGREPAKVRVIIRRGEEDAAPP